MEFPDNVKYTKEHEWVRVEDDGSVTIGITDYAQQQLGDIVYVELPEVGEDPIVKDAPFAVVESVKAVSDVYAPITGLITVTLTGAPRPSWGANLLRGKFLIGADSFQNAVIIENTTTTLLISQVVSAATTPTGDLTIREPSAHITCSSNVTPVTVTPVDKHRAVESPCASGGSTVTVTVSTRTIGSGGGALGRSTLHALHNTHSSSTRFMPAPAPAHQPRAQCRCGSHPCV